jgi:hypothetical protein
MPAVGESRYRDLTASRRFMTAAEAAAAKDAERTTFRQDDAAGSSTIVFVLSTRSYTPT